MNDHSSRRITLPIVDKGFDKTSGVLLMITMRLIMMMTVYYQGGNGNRVPAV